MPENSFHKDEYLQLLKELIALPSFSKEEDQTAELLVNFLQGKNIEASRRKNNVWCSNTHFDKTKPTLLLNSHHDTVAPNKGYSLNPFEAVEKDWKIYGLGSNDAGASLVALLACFVFFYEEKNLPFNLIFAATAEEEISGEDGVVSIFDELSPIWAAIVGEPTEMKMATAEKNLLVLDGVIKGVSGHAAREVGDNAIYKTQSVIDWIKNFRFEKESADLGPVKMTVTSIETPNKAHNVIPDLCNLIVDVRNNGEYSAEEILETIRKNTEAEWKPRLLRKGLSRIEEGHPLVKAGKKIGLESFGSPTSSDKSLMPWPALKMGPGDSNRSHSADEYIFIKEIEEGIDMYIELIKALSHEALG